VEPFLVIGYIMFYLGPYFPAIWILRKIQARRPVDSFVWRHPLISLALLILPLGIIIDAMLEVTLVRTGFYIYAQVIPFGSVFADRHTNSRSSGNRDGDVRDDPGRRAALSR